MKLTTKDSDIATAKTILLTKAKGAQLTVEQKAAVSKGVLAAALAAEDISLDKNTLTTVKNKVAAMVLNGAKKEEIVAYLATIPGITAETAAKIANKLATDALKTSIMGLLGPIALIIAAVTAVVAAFTAWNKAQEEAAKWDAEQNQEQVDKIMERVDALKTERQEFESLMKAYEDAKANQDGTAAAQQAIADATWDICEALGIEIDLIDKL
jgi:RNA polymerase-binding transcription factor DksA